MSLTIYGASDDLIEVEGDIREEFSCLEDEGRILALSNGVVLRVRYVEGVWRIMPVRGAIAIVQAPEGDEDNYSDKATIEGVIEWVVCGTEMALRRDKTGAN